MLRRISARVTFRPGATARRGPEAPGGIRTARPPPAPAARAGPGTRTPASARSAPRGRYRGHVGRPGRRSQEEVDVRRQRLDHLRPGVEHDLPGANRERAHSAGSGWRRRRSGSQNQCGRRNRSRTRAPAGKSTEASASAGAGAPVVSIRRARDHRVSARGRAEVLHPRLELAHEPPSAGAAAIRATASAATTKRSTLTRPLLHRERVMSYA